MSRQAGSIVRGEKAALDIRKRASSRSQLSTADRPSGQGASGPCPNPNIPV